MSNSRNSASPDSTPPWKESSQKGRIPSLDGWRGLAILMVLIGHGSPSLPESLRSILHFFGRSSLGVQIFFVLSGYLIYRLSTREIQIKGTFNWKGFYFRRILRIFPCFYLYILTVVILNIFGLISIDWKTILSSATFTLNYQHIWNNAAENQDYVAIGHYWTLSLEEQFYLTWPLLMFCFSKSRLLPILISIVISAPFLRVLFYYLTPGSRGQLGMMFHTGFDSIAAGVLLGELLNRKNTRLRIEKMASSKLFTFSLITFLVFFSPYLSSKFKGSYGLTIGTSASLFAICILLARSITFENTLMFRILNYKPLAFIGILSFSLYVWNNLFLLCKGHWFNLFPYNFTMLTATAFASYFLIEKPFLSIKSRFQKHQITETV